MQITFLVDQPTPATPNTTVPSPISGFQGNFYMTRPRVHVAGDEPTHTDTDASVGSRGAQLIISPHFRSPFCFLTILVPPPSSPRGLPFPVL